MQIGQVVEGLTTAPVLRDLSRRIGVELPITEGVCAVLSGMPLDELLASLMGRRPIAGVRAAAVLLALTLLASSCGSGTKPASSAAEVAPRSTYALLAGDPAKTHPALDLLPARAGDSRRCSPAGERSQRARRRAGRRARRGRHACGRLRAPRRPQAPRRHPRRCGPRPRSRSRLDGVLAAAPFRAKLVRRTKEHLSDARWFRPPAVRSDASFVLRGLTVTADAHGDTVEARRTTLGGGSNAPHPLAAFVPDDAVAAAAVHDGARVFGGLSVAAQLQQGLGLRVDHLAEAAPTDAVVFARPGQPVPSITLIAAGTSKAASARVVSDLAPNAPPARRRRSTASR